MKITGGIANIGAKRAASRLLAFSCLHLLGGKQLHTGRVW